MNESPLQTRTIIRLWLPLALTWAMMAAEGLIIQSVLSGLPSAEVNLAAFGVAIGVAFIVESPIIMLLSASTAYVKGAGSYRVVRAVAFGLSFGVSLAMLALLAPPVFDWLSAHILGLPSELGERVYWCMVALLPWPGLIGVRRFYQGVIIRGHMNRYIALGTAFRLLTIILGASLMRWLFAERSDTASIACCVLSCAVGLETLATWLMAQSAISLARGTPDPDDYQLTHLGLLRLYLPLAMTSIVAMGIGPVLIAFMTRFPSAIESLAVYPVVDGFVFQFRSPLFAYQEVAISLFAAYGLGQRIIDRMGYRIALIATAILICIVATPLASVVFGVFPYRLSPSLVERAIVATALLVPLPFASAVYSNTRAALILTNRSRQVAYSTFFEAGITIAAIGALALWSVELDGVYAASIAITVGKGAAAAYLLRIVHRNSPGYRFD